MDVDDEAAEEGRDIRGTSEDLEDLEIGATCIDSVSLASLELSPSTMIAIGEGGTAASAPSGAGRLLLAFGVDKSKDDRKAVVGGGKAALLPNDVFQTGADGGGRD
jgi:hypothetical protein